ncbi:hypothetical protein C2G38_2063611 [Gigaspora rosea]|uniref:Uncharacterized protein n=1 Tax=Gigaspora rosea TaxID=44941 RepID=A0A397W3P2_9GLOM|nr:hypothetical protein C2G38_2063611 [Gigaspora rosea]
MQNMQFFMILTVVQFLAVVNMAISIWIVTLIKINNVVLVVHMKKQLERQMFIFH